MESYGIENVVTVQTSALRHLSDPTTVGRPVLLVHGFASDAERDFEDTGLTERLLQAGLLVSVVDLPGHGRGQEVSSEQAGRTTCIVDYLASAVRKTAHFYRSDSIDVLGYSLGARLVWDLAAVDVSIGKMVLGGLSPQEPFASLDTNALRQVVNGQSVTLEPLMQVMASMVSQSGSDADSLINLIGGLGAEPFVPTAFAPHVPVLLLAGDQDPMCQGIEGLLPMLGNAQLERVPGDHLSVLSGSEFSERVIRFLA